MSDTLEQPAYEYEVTFSVTLESDTPLDPEDIYAQALARVEAADCDFDYDGPEDEDDEDDEDN